jgi:hypothetical protein
LRETKKKIAAGFERPKRAAWGVISILSGSEMGEMQWKTKFQIDRAAKWAGKRAAEVSSACQQCRRVGDAAGNKRVGEDTDEITGMKRHSTPSNAARHHRWPKRVMVREKERKSSISLCCFSFSAPQCFLLSRSFFFLFLKSQLAFSRTVFASISGAHCSLLYFFLLLALAKLLCVVLREFIANSASRRRGFSRLSAKTRPRLNLLLPRGRESASCRDWDANFRL